MFSIALLLGGRIDFLTDTPRLLFSCFVSRCPSTLLQDALRLVAVDTGLFFSRNFSHSSDVGSRSRDPLGLRVYVDVLLDLSAAPLVFSRRTTLVVAENSNNSSAQNDLVLLLFERYDRISYFL